MKKYAFKKTQVILRKRLCFILEKVYVNNRPFLVLTGTGFAADILLNYMDPIYGFLSYYPGKRRFLRDLFFGLENYKQLNNISTIGLKLVGTGYKSIVPRRFHYKHLYLRVGFSASEILYKNFDKRVRLRARKQKILLFGFNKRLLSTYGAQISNLRYPNAYTGKGIRRSNSVFVLKPRKQQQRK